MKMNEKHRKHAIKTILVEMAIQTYSLQAVLIPEENSNKEVKSVSGLKKEILKIVSSLNDTKFRNRIEKILDHTSWMVKVVKAAKKKRG